MEQWKNFRSIALSEVYEMKCSSVALLDAQPAGLEAFDQRHEQNFVWVPRHP